MIGQMSGVTALRMNENVREKIWYFLIQKNDNGLYKENLNH